MKINKVHKGWFILGITVFNSFAALGLGRFSLGAILPFMKEGLMLNYTQTGLISSAVFMGYLVGAIGVGYLTNYFSTKKVLQAALLLTALGMSSSCFAFNFWSAYLAFLFIGLGSGAANVTSLSVVNRWFTMRYRGMALGITNSGSSFGMILSGSLVPLLMLMHTEGWRVSWGILAAAVVIIFLINLLYLKEDPVQLDLKPIGTNGSIVDGGEEQKEYTGLQIENIYRHKYILFTGVIYFSWGFSYLIFSTFFVDYLISDTSVSPTLAGQFFAVAGVASIVSGFIWGSLSDKLGRMLTLFFIYFGQASLLLLFVFSQQPTLLLVETILYSLTLWAVPTIIVAAISDLTHVSKAALAIGFITLFFGVGQWLSPMISGWLIDFYGSYTVAFYLSAAICYLGGLGCLGMHWELKRVAARTKQKVVGIPEKT